MTSHVRLTSPLSMVKVQWFDRPCSGSFFSFNHSLYFIWVKGGGVDHVSQQRKKPFHNLCVLKKAAKAYKPLDRLGLYHISLDRLDIISSISVILYVSTCERLPKNLFICLKTRLACLKTRQYRSLAPLLFSFYRAILVESNASWAIEQIKFQAPI